MTQVQHGANGTTSLWDKRQQERDTNETWLRERRDYLDFQGLYLGDEMNTYHFDWDEAIREGRIDDTWRVVLMNLCASNAAFSARAIMLFYQFFHEYDPAWVVERSLCPPTQNNRLRMKEDGIRPFAVESKMPLDAFDVICMSMDLTESVVAVPWTILESGLPLDAAARSEDDPFVILGGSAVVNPGPLLPFPDIFFFGEGEVVLPELIALLQDGRRRGMAREEILLAAAGRWDCLYIPRFYEDRYDENGNFAGTFRLREDVPARVTFFRNEHLDDVFISTKPFLNFTTHAPETSHSDLSRGCEGKCSFCLSGFTGLPFRSRSVSLFKKVVQQIIYETGNTSVIPVSYNVVSCPQINELVRDLHRQPGVHVNMISMRIDGFLLNPELCAFLSQQRRGRILFGVEGASQRLRDMLSKNLSEAQLLETMRAVCRAGYRSVKFMMICGLPSETAADLEELYQLAVKIRAIFDEETPASRPSPKLLISWNVLSCAPHTPLQWAQCPRELMEAYADFTEKIHGLGFNTFPPRITADNTMSQLFLRADSRLSGLLAFLAREGDLKHTEAYEDAVVEKTVRYLAMHGLPPIESWFREYAWEEPLPWEIVQGPASKEYLYRRYQAVHQTHPVSTPICTEACSSCGACSREMKRLLKSIPAQRDIDRRVQIRDAGGDHVQQSPRAVQHVLMHFTYDEAHAVVTPSYWDCEIRRALLHAGIPFDYDSVRSFGSNRIESHTALGCNVTNISLHKRYDLTKLQAAIQAHAINFKVASIEEIDTPRMVETVTYRIPLPTGLDETAAAARVREKLAEDAWPYIASYDNILHPVMNDLRPCVRELDVKDGSLVVTMGPAITAPLYVYLYVFDIPYAVRPHPLPERIGFTFAPWK